jgi:YD repeat-containing protein
MSQNVRGCANANRYLGVSHNNLFSITSSLTPSPFMPRQLAFLLTTLQRLSVAKFFIRESSGSASRRLLRILEIGSRPPRALRFRQFQSAALGRTLLFWTLALVAPAFAQQPQSETRHIYDNGDKLIETISPSGERFLYEYDADGNLILIRREAAAALEILSFSPSEGPVGTKVTILGKGFNATPTANAVTFNGTPATVLSASAGRLEVVVPPGATVGPITVATTGPAAATADPFTVVTGIDATPLEFTAAENAAFQFRASVSPPQVNQEIVWSVNGVPGGNPMVGTVSVTGLYLAPATLPATSVTLRAASASYPSVYRDIPIRFSASSLSLAQGVSVQVGAPFSEAQAAASVFVGPPFADIRSFGVSVRYAPPPSIASFSPAAGPVGASVVITGANFQGATGVAFNGVRASATVSPDGTQLFTVVPPGATPGAIVVSKTLRDGSQAINASSATSFCVSDVPGAFTVSPANQTVSANGGTVVATIVGTGCWTASANAQWATLSAAAGNGNASLTVTVAPNGGASRTVTVNVAGRTLVITQEAASAAQSFSRIVRHRHFTGKRK